MINNNDEIRQYPLNQITQMRKKDEKRKKVLKIILTVICFILVFAIGFVSGFYYGDSEKFKSASPVGAISSAKSDGLDTANASDGNDTVAQADNKESEILEKLKNQFVNTVSQLYPDVDFSFAIKNLDSQISVVYNDKQMNSASVIKLFIMETVLKETAAGSYELTDQKEEALFKMITDSNNDASNLFIDDFGGVDETRKVTADNIINKTIVQSGYKYTQANRKMHNSTPPGGPTGYENYTSAGDVVKLLEGIYNNTLLPDSYNAKALNLLKNQKRREKIPAKILEAYPDVTVANKTGELSKVENDVALIMCDDFNLAFAVFINDIPEDANGQYHAAMHEKIRGTIADFGLELVKAYKTNNF